MKELVHATSRDTFVMTRQNLKGPGLEIRVANRRVSPPINNTGIWQDLSRGRVRDMVGIRARLHTS